MAPCNDIPGMTIGAPTGGRAQGFKNSYTMLGTWEASKRARCRLRRRLIDILRYSVWIIPASMAFRDSG